MFDYMDRLIRIVRPISLLYLAVDGVAPRAKMNQQRARRFKSAMAAKQAEVEENILRDRFRAEGKKVLPQETSSSSEVSDPNVITPGTEFMDKLSDALKYYIRAHLNSDPLWKDINDADLIMLALASHEVHFSILREAEKFKCRAWFPRITEARPEGKLTKKPYQTLDVERMIDDFVFICFLTGNDFIPHIPSLEIHEGAIDLLIEVYKTSFNKMGGYIVDTDKNFQRKIERQAAENTWNERNTENVEENLDDQCIMVKSSQTDGQVSDEQDITMNTLELRKNLKDILHNKQDLIKTGACKHDKIKLGSPGWKSRFFKEKFDAETKDEIAKLQNEMVTISCFLNYANGILYLTVQKYLEGLCWVLCYYFADVPSWSCSFALPGCYSKLMDCDESAIQAFYPSELDIDTDGKRYLWQGIAKLPFIEDKLLLSVTKTAEKDLAVHELRRNTVRQEKIFLRNSNALAKNEAFAQTSDCSLQKLPIDPATSEIGGWLSPDDDDFSNGFCGSPIENDLSISAKFFNPEAVKPATRLLQNVTVPYKTVTEADICTRPLWHTHPYPKHPALSMHNVQQQRLQSSRPETPCWKPRTPPPPRREEIRSAGTGWLGRGRGGNIPVAVAASTAVAGETRQSWSSSRYGRGRGSGATAVGHGQMTTTRHQWSGGGGYGRSSGVDNGGGRGSYNLRPGGGGGGGGGYQWQQQQQTAWRPVGSPWGRGGGGGDGGNGQPRGL
uniref:Uncharacterized protein n=1 Tax=Oryza nivara TaxID=4536 RepID=A0A0E0I4F2_ORYNI